MSAQKNMNTQKIYRFLTGDPDTKCLEVEDLFPRREDHPGRVCYEFAYKARSVYLNSQLTVNNEKFSAIADIANVLIICSHAIKQDDSILGEQAIFISKDILDSIENLPALLKCIVEKITGRLQETIENEAGCLKAEAQTISEEQIVYWRYACAAAAVAVALVIVLSGGLLGAPILGAALVGFIQSTMGAAVFASLSTVTAVIAALLFGNNQDLQKQLAGNEEEMNGLNKKINKINLLQEQLLGVMDKTKGNVEGEEKRESNKPS